MVYKYLGPKSAVASSRAGDIVNFHLVLRQPRGRSAQGGHADQGGWDDKPLGKPHQRRDVDRRDVSGAYHHDDRNARVEDENGGFVDDVESGEEGDEQSAGIKRSEDDGDDLREETGGGRQEGDERKGRPEEPEGGLEGM